MSQTNKLLDKINKYNRYLETKEDKDKYQNKLNKYINKYNVLLGGELTPQDNKKYVQPVMAEISNLLKIQKKSYDTELIKMLNNLQKAVTQYKNTATKVEDVTNEDEREKLENDLKEKEKIIILLEKQIREKSNNDEKIVEVVEKIISIIKRKQQDIQNTEFKLSKEIDKKLQELMGITKSSK